MSPVDPKPKIHYTNYDYGIFLAIFISFVVFVWLYVSNRKRLGQFIKGFYTSKSGSPLSRDEFSGTGRISFVLSLLFLLTMTLFAGQVAGYYGLEVPGGIIARYAAIALGLLVIYGGKILVVQVSGFVFKTGKETGEYVSTLLLFTNLLGLFLLPVVMCLAFFRQVSPAVFIYTGYAIICGFLTVRLIRGLAIGINSSRVSGFYLFLYLCTLEIIPFIVLIKAFMLYV